VIHKQGSHSNVRIKIQDFFRTFQDLKYQTSGRILVPFRRQTMALIAEQDTLNVMPKMQCTWHGVDIAVAFLNINDDIQQCSSSITSAFI